MSDQKKTGKSRWKREIIEWSVFLGIILMLYATGLHKPVISTLQRGVLMTGILRPDTTPDEDEFLKSNYNMPLQTLDGEKLSLNDFRDKVVFMNFWATWCPPCIAEMPNIQSLYESIENEDIVFLMISLDESPETAKKFIDKKGFTFPVYVQTGYRPAIFESSVVPTTYIISKDGNIVSKKRGMAQYDTDRFRDFLNELAES